MDARQSKQRDRAVESPETSPVESSHLESSAQRVMSISPTDIDPDAEPMTIDQDDILLTPRVLDQNAFNQLSETLRGLIEQANGAAQLLRDEFEQADGAKGQASKASAGLHERLRVSARMLKAFQSQIDLVQERIGQLTAAGKEAQEASSRLEGLAEKFESRVTDAAAMFERQVDETFESRIKRFEEELAKREQAVANVGERVAEAQGRVNDLLTDTERRVDALLDRTEGKVQPIVTDAQQQVEALLGEVRGSVETVTGNAKKAVSGLIKGTQGRIESLEVDAKRGAAKAVAQTQRCVDSIAKVAEGAEKNAADAVIKSAAATEKIEKAASETSQIIAQVNHARKLLGEDLLKAAERIDQLSARSEKICRSVRGGQEELESAARRLSEAVAHVNDADKKRRQLKQTCDTLAPLLEQLRPWEALFESTAGEQGVGAHPIIRLLDEMRSGLGEDAARLSGTMRHMAARLDDLLRLNRGKATATIEVRDELREPPQITTAVKDPPKPAAKSLGAPGKAQPS
ncbi:MAG: hypothetical protein IIA64_08335 [Planctomycetes bacterium]|nr:hypothetical protein [Planctomycetota bacterium]